MVMNRKRTESLSSVDVAWYQMEDPTNLMMITGIVVFNEPVDFARLKATLEVRFVGRYRRFRQRVVARTSRFGRPYWEDDPNFDLSAHLHRIALPAPGDHQTLQDLVSDLMSTPLDFSKPLWQMHLIDGYEDRCVLLVRLHHCIADGIALVQVMLSLTDADPNAAWPQPEARTGTRRGWNPLAPVVRPTRAALTLTQKVATTTVRTSLRVTRNPEELIDLARKGTDVALTTGRLLLMSPDPKTVYKGKLGVAKKAAWSQPIPLEDVRLIGRAAGGTINDVLMAAAAGAMRRYLVQRGAVVDNLDFRAVIPVNLRPPHKATTLGNKFGLVFLSLPIGIADPVERLRELKQRMDSLKDSTEPIVAFGILGLIGMMPDRLEDVVVDIFGAKGTLVMTNVPGPREPLFLAGAAIDQMIVWVPQSGRLGLGISILSYNGQVTIGVATDTGLVPDPETIVANFHEELTALKEEMRQRLLETAVKFDILPAPGPQGQELEALLTATETLVQHQPAQPSAEGENGADAAFEPALLNGDDLTRISGIGPSFAGTLRSAGITTFAQLAAASPDSLAATIAVPDWRRPDLQDWITQAQGLVGK